MLEIYFKDPRTLDRLRSGSAGPFLDGFAAVLHECGYRGECGALHLRGAAHLGRWAEDLGILIESLNEGTIEAFERHLAHCQCPGQRPSKHRSTVARARGFLDYLRRTGASASTGVPAEKAEQPPLLEAFCRWMRKHRGVTEGTLSVYSRIIVELLKSLGDDPSSYDAEAVRGFVREHASRHGISKAKLTATATRMFLRFLVARGHCCAELDGAIPQVAHWRLSALPRYLPAADVERIVAACDPATPVGSRDRAIVLLLARLALRAGDIASMRIADIDWDDASLLVAGKGRREARLPLSQEVGDAILRYLQHGRPPLDSDRLFLTAIAPWRALRPSGVSSIAVRAIRRAGVESPSHGAHVLRHSAATEMLRQGATLREIGAILRHRSIETTAYYAKVDVAMLQQIAQPWPEVASC